MALWTKMTRAIDRVAEAMGAYDVADDSGSYERVEEGYKREKLNLGANKEEMPQVSREAKMKANYDHLVRYGMPGRGYNNRFDLVRGAPPMPYEDVGTCIADDYLFVKDAHRPVEKENEHEGMLPQRIGIRSAISPRMSFGNRFVELKNKWFGGR